MELAVDLGSTREGDQEEISQRAGDSQTLRAHSFGRENTAGLVRQGLGLFGDGALVSPLQI